MANNTECQYCWRFVKDGQHNEGCPALDERNQREYRLGGSAALRGEIIQLWAWLKNKAGKT